jgi:PadR family transcriptional regulator, regulatory protein PadR
MTTQTLQLIGVLLSEPDAEWYGLQLAGEAGLKSGSVYVVLGRLEQAGWLTSRWEEIDPSAEGRPRRRLYALTGEGRRAGADAIEQHLAALTGARSARTTPARRPGVATS